MKRLLLILLFIPLISSSSDEEISLQSEVQTPKAEINPVPTPTQYTLVVSSEEGGSVSTNLKKVKFL